MNLKNQFCLYLETEGLDNKVETLERSEESGSVSMQDIVCDRNLKVKSFRLLFWGLNRMSI